MHGDCWFQLSSRESLVVKQFETISNTLKGNRLAADRIVSWKSQASRSFFFFRRRFEFRIRSHKAPCSIWYFHVEVQRLNGQRLAASTPPSLSQPHGAVQFCLRKAKFQGN